VSSVLDAFSDAIMEKAAPLKILVYAIPVFLAASSYIGGQTQAFNFWKFVTGALFFRSANFWYLLRQKQPRESFDT
jgi:hypothetical protein